MDLRAELRYLTHRADAGRWHYLGGHLVWRLLDALSRRIDRREGTR